MPTSQTVWNAILTVVGAALLAAIGFLYNAVSELKVQTASIKATRFTEEEALKLRSDITLTLTSIDKRLAIMENNNDWIRQWVTSAHANPNPGHNEAPPVPVKKSEKLPSKSPNIIGDGSPVRPAPNAPRYDLRQQQRKK